jgi:non-specific serine/threonine protein kinase
MSSSSPALLVELWSDMGTVLGAEKPYKDGVQGYFKKHGSVWNVVGRVCFHLAENKRDPGFPFAFIAFQGVRVGRRQGAFHIRDGRASGL